MENDDQPVGQVLSRRDALKFLGIGSAAFLAACASPEGTSTPVPTAWSTQIAPTSSSALDCVVRPEMTIGPYFVDDQLNRSDIRSNSSDTSVKEGIPLTLNIALASVSDNSCTPIEGGQVDLWHCDAQGQYSGVSDQGFDTTGQDFLRGYQLTDANGGVQFQTIYPGWYSGRAVHIHFTIRTRVPTAQTINLPPSSSSTIRSQTKSMHSNRTIAKDSAIHATRTIISLWAAEISYYSICKAKPQVALLPR